MFKCRISSPASDPQVILMFVKFQETLIYPGDLKICWPAYQLALSLEIVIGRTGIIPGNSNFSNYLQMMAFCHQESSKSSGLSIIACVPGQAIFLITHAPGSRHSSLLDSFFSRPPSKWHFLGLMCLILSYFFAVVAVLTLSSSLKFSFDPGFH